MANKRKSVRVMRSNDDSLLGNGDEVIFIRSVELASRRIPMGATGRIIQTFPQLRIKLDKEWCTRRSASVVSWPSAIDPRNAFMKLESAVDSTWLDLESPPIAALEQAKYLSSRPPPSTLRSPI